MEYKTVWISDLHLGTRGCDAQGLLNFLCQTDFERLNLVGDVINLWRLKKDHDWDGTGAVETSGATYPSVESCRSIGVAHPNRKSDLRMERRDWATRRYSAKADSLTLPKVNSSPSAEVIRC